MNFRKILIAVDESACAERAADVGFELARSLGAELALIHVIDPTLAAAPESGYPGGDLIALARQEGRKLLAELGKRAPAKRATVEFIPVGKPAAEIVKEAKEWQADLIVTGSHGRRGVQRFLLGSVAEAVMRHAPCPILVVPAEGS